MAPKAKAKATAAERTRQLVKQAQSTSDRAVLQLVKDALRVHGIGAAQPCYRSLVSLNFIDDEKKEVLVPEGMAVATKKKLAEEPAVDFALKPFPKLADTWANSSVESLSAILSDCEPCSLSSSNLRGLGKKHSKFPPKSMVLQLWEFVFGIDSNSKVPTMERYLDLHRWLMQKNETNGRRAVSINLPPEWSQDGHYLVKHEGRSWWLGSRFTDNWVQLDQANDPEGMLELTIDMSWNEHRATVRDSTCANIQEVCRSFLGRAASQRAPGAFVSPAKRLYAGSSASSRCGDAAPHAAFPDDAGAALLQIEGPKRPRLAIADGRLALPAARSDDQ